MGDDSGYPISIVLDGPTFRDELTRQPQEIKQQHDIESLRLVPGKSAASGVHAIYFVQAHREWALVRLARRYRWVLEVQLNRGMSGERQLLGQGFEPEDLEFLFDIIPQPPQQYSPIVYDMLWLVATYEEYVLLTEAMVKHETPRKGPSNVFTPRALLRSFEGIDESDAGYFTRFLRSHLIEPIETRSGETDNQDMSRESGPSVDLDAPYLITPEGKDALEGILSEYSRIFVEENFEPLLINPDQDPHKHLRDYEPEASKPSPDVSFEEIRDDDGVLGEIAESFSSIVEKIPENEAGKSLDSAKDDPKEREGTDPVVVPNKHNPKQGGEPFDTHFASSTDEQSIETNVTDKDEKQPSTDTPVSEETMVGDFSREEILEGTHAAAALIARQKVVRTQVVKEAVWKKVEIGDGEKAEFWEQICHVLIAMDEIQGRPDGRVWVSKR